MSNQKKVLSFAVLGAALLALAEKAKGTPAETGLQDFTEDFNALGKQVEGVVSDLTDQLEAALDKAADKSAKPVITIDKIKYVINHGSHPFSAEELAQNEKECRRILKLKGQNAISKL